MNFTAAKNMRIWLACSIVAVVIYHFSYGLETLIPTNISWLMEARHDWGTHYLGWYFYRNEVWGFPLGTIHNYYYPLGTNIGFTDSIPLLSIFFKFFSRLLPENFQYIGIWLLICILLSAFYTILLLRRLGIKDLYIFLIVIFVMSNPVLIYRAIHPALCAHWLFIAGIYCYLKTSDESAVKKTLLHQYIILLLSALINPYLCLIVLGFTFIIPLRQYLEKHSSIKALIFYNVASLVSVFMVWYIIGLVTIGAKEDLAVQTAYGLYSLNLNAFFNSMGFSTFLPKLQMVSWHQYEGFMFLGLGIMLLVLAALTIFVVQTIQKKRNPLLWVRRNSKAIIPLAILVVCFSAFSITNIVSLNDKILFQFPIPSIIKDLGDTFRASARFFWLPYYLLFIGCLIFVVRAQLNEKVKFSLIILALVIQLYDIKLLLTHREFTYGPYAPPLDGKNWSILMKGFDTIIVYPPFQATYVKDHDYQDLCYLAARERKPITTGYVARSDNRAARAFTDSLETNLDAATMDERTLFITPAINLNRFSFLLQTGIAKLNTLDNYFFLFSSQLKDSSVISLSQKLNGGKKEKLDSALTLFGKVNSLKRIRSINLAKENEIHYNFDRYTDTEQFILLYGWAFNSTVQTNKGDSVFIFLKSDKNTYLGATTKIMRPDVTSYFNRAYLDEAGFSSTVSKEDLVKGKYKVGIAIKNHEGQFTYKPTTQFTTVGAPVVSVFEKLENPVLTSEISQNIDVLEDHVSFIKIVGWAHLKNQNTDGCQISLILKKGSDFFSCPTETAFRPDVTGAFKNGFNLDSSGYSVRLKKTVLPKGEYQLGIHIKDVKRKREGFLLTEKKIVF